MDISYLRSSTGGVMISSMHSTVVITGALLHEFWREPRREGQRHPPRQLYAGSCCDLYVLLTNMPLLLIYKLDQQQMHVRLSVAEGRELPVGSAVPQHLRPGGDHQLHLLPAVVREGVRRLLHHLRDQEVLVCPLSWLAAAWLERRRTTRKT